ncbi:MAG: glycosyltransferase [Pseudomonadales bacterium]
MRILIITYGFPPLNSVASLRPYSFAKAFTNQGHEVTVATAAKPSNPLDLALDCSKFEVIEVHSKLLARLYRWLSINRGTNPGTQSNRSRSFLKRINQLRTRRGLLVLGRLPDLLDLLIRPTKKALAGRQWDLVISSYAPRYCHEVAASLRSNGSANYWIADFRDLWTLHHQFKGLFPFTVLERRLEHRYLRQADLVTTVSADLSRNLAEHAQREVEVFTNGFDPDDLQQLPSTALYTDDKIHLVYTGTIYPSWGSYKHFLTAVAKLRRASPELYARLQITFAGSDIANLGKRSEDLGLSDCIKFIGPQIRPIALQMQRDSHVQLFFEPSKGTGIATGKLFEYISSGTLVWRIGPARSTVATKLLEQSATGIDLGQDSESISQALGSLARDGTKPHIKPNRAVIDRYDRQLIASRLLAAAVQGMSS